MPRAVAYFEFGSPEVLRFMEVDQLVPGPGQVLLETRAIGVNPAEVQRERGSETRHVVGKIVLVP